MDSPTRTNSINAIRKHQTRPRAARQILLGASLVAVFSFLCLFLSRNSPDAPQPAVVAASTQSERSAIAQARAAYGQLPLSFEANRGQADESVNFLARGAGYTLTLSPTEAVFALARRSDGRSQKNEPAASRADGNGAVVRASREAESFTAHGSEPSAVLRMNLVGADRGATVEGLNELEGKVNYLIGSDKSQWRTNISTYARVRYRQVYPGIDVVYYGNQRNLEYDFVVAPGRHADAIKLRFEGADQVEVDAAGDLLLSVGESVVRQPKPVVYQEVDGERLAVAGDYVVARDGQVSFSVGAYDESLPLVIDPTLVYSTYLGGNDFEDGNDIKVDSAGNAYICGQTASTNFPTANALQATFAGSTFPGGFDGFVTKLNPSGTGFVYSTYLGGSGDDRCNKIAVDSTGNAYVAGETTSSTNFPRANAFQNTFGGGLSDAFVTKLNAAGNALIFSTYLGGDVFDAANGIALDSSNNVYVTGRTTSPNFPTANAIQATQAGIFADAFVTKLNAAGSALVYSTYLGGSDGTEGGFDAGFSIAVDSAGSAYVTGQTRSTNFPTVNAVQATFGGGFPDGDAFVTKVNAAGTAFAYSTYLGGSANDIGFEIAVDSTGSAYIAGVVRSTNFPTANAFQSALKGPSDAFMTKLSPAGTAFAYSTYFGGTGDDSANGIAVNANNEPYLAIGTSSTDLPIANPTQAASGGGVDAAVTRFNAAGNALIYSTYLGGSGTDAGLSIDLDSALSMYIVGRTTSTNFPTLNPVQSANGGGQDAFVTKISESNPTTVQFSSSSTTNVQEACTSIQLTITRSGPTTGTTVVNFATTDGTAQQKSDYTIALGRLTFAPGETSKTINLLISEDSYVEGNETFTVTLSGATGGSVNAPGTATIQITDDPVEPTTNAIDDSAVFVCQQYHDLLMRQPEPAGLQFYLDYLNGCQSTDTECIKFRRGTVATNFFHSPEFMQKGSFVMYLYMITLGQRPATVAELTDSTKVDRPHYTEFMMDLNYISDPNDDKAVVSALKDALTVNWLQRPEIQAIFGNLTNEQFVQKLESTAGVTLANRNTLIANLNNSTQTRAQVLRAVAESPEVNAKFYRQAFVTMEYFGFLRREPESCFGNPNPAQCGYIFHNSGFNSMSNIEVAENLIIRGFIESPEYRQRFGP